MLLEMSQFCSWRTLLLLLSTVGYGHASKCTTRRCLAEMLIKKKMTSQPQYENCTQEIDIPLIEYQTLAVDTKNLHLVSSLKVTMVWKDPELQWNTSEYEYNQVVVPVNTVWTPVIRITNGVSTTTKHSSSDLLVHSNGSLKHSLLIYTEVNCEVNLFNYPFASDACPVAIHTWSSSECGTTMNLDKLKMSDSSHGDWQTDSVAFDKKPNGQNYILVKLRIRFLNPFITLMMPSILIIVADVVSFALPLGGGERNSFKVTLVLSFTMFLIILNDELPGDSYCRPIIRTHFCICLVTLVVSMLVSMVLTRVAKEGGIMFCCRSKCSTRKKDKKEDEEDKADISVIQLSASEQNSHVIRKVVSFLDAQDAKEQESEKKQKIANMVDKTVFWMYFVLALSYFCGMFYVLVNRVCSIDHFDFYSDYD
ncbi:5-hydroxytryptamine receptor 3A-like [Sphaeramia orbicularis]|uniref:5-hydroxytryptamine receptor 3A-like n=1 Tax=Sphaeramia orbicularis TaxID=375764 RepID=UPI00117D265B|nr:5-hydroxytryptamine receptor 3A-like [Sphaeramia orbicularis]